MYSESLLVMTPGRELRLTAGTREQHETWMNVSTIRRHMLFEKADNPIIGPVLLDQQALSSYDVGIGKFPSSGNSYYTSAQRCRRVWPKGKVPVF